MLVHVLCMKIWPFIQESQIISMSRGYFREFNYQDICWFETSKNDHCRCGTWGCKCTLLLKSKCLFPKIKIDLLLPEWPFYFLELLFYFPEVSFCFPEEMFHWRISSLFHTKITGSVTKSSHQDCGQCYLHLPIFSFTYTLLLCGKMKSCCDCCFP